jgi:hypothetical protein
MKWKAISLASVRRLIQFGLDDKQQTIIAAGFPSGQRMS